jgi:hypothetical protein
MSEKQRIGTCMWCPDGIPQEEFHPDGCARHREDLTKHPNVGVRWQAQMEEHLREVRTLTSEAMRLAVTVPTVAQSEAFQTQLLLRAGLAQANAQAASALALANSLGDLEVQSFRHHQELGELAAKITDSLAAAIESIPEVRQALENLEKNDPL